jgi:Caspase domain
MRWLSTFALGFALWSFMLAEACAEKRIALIIGNGAYKHANWVLPNPPHDAEDVAGALKRVGFETILATDLDQAAMQEATIRFARAARGADVAIFYYSGHAMQYSGVNYLIPVDADLRDEADLRRMARVDQILGDLQQAKNLRILVLDSCRDNPIAEQLKRSIGLTRSATIGVGLAKMESPDGTIISFATQAGQKAEDGTGRNSPYTKAFLNHIEEKEEIGTVFRRISADVRETTNRTQVPELSLSFFGEFYLNGKLQITVTPPPPSVPADPAPARSSAVPQTREWTRTLPMASARPRSPKQSNKRSIGTFFSLNPDCTRAVFPTIRIIEQPKHGKITFENGTGFPVYVKDNPRYECNKRRSDGALVFYEPELNFIGTDSVLIEVFYYASSERQHYALEVK